MSIRVIHDVYLADTARVLGDVKLGKQVSLWYGAAVRGDVAPVTIGDRTNVQDNAVVHCDTGVPNVIGRDVTIGHGAIVHGASIGDGTLIGMGATVLGRSMIGAGCLIAAGALVTPRMEVPDGMVVKGIPGKVVRPTSDEEKAYLTWAANRYIELALLHTQQPNDARVRPWDGEQPPQPADSRQR